MLHIKSSIENIGIDFLFKDTSQQRCEFQDWIKHVKEAEEINKRKVNRLNSAKGRISKDKSHELVRRQSSDDILTPDNFLGERYLIRIVHLKNKLITL